MNLNLKATVPAPQPRAQVIPSAEFQKQQAQSMISGLMGEEPAQNADGSAGQVVEGQVGNLDGSQSGQSGNVLGDYYTHLAGGNATGAEDVQFQQSNAQEPQATPNNGASQVNQQQVNQQQANPLQAQVDRLEQILSVLVTTGALSLDDVSGAAGNLPQAPANGMQNFVTMPVTPQATLPMDVVGQQMQMVIGPDDIGTETEVANAMSDAGAMRNLLVRAVQKAATKVMAGVPGVVNYGLQSVMPTLHGNINATVMQGIELQNQLNGFFSGNPDVTTQKELVVSVANNLATKRKGVALPVLLQNAANLVRVSLGQAPVNYTAKNNQQPFNRAQGQAAPMPAPQAGNNRQVTQQKSLTVMQQKIKSMLDNI